MRCTPHSDPHRIPGTHMAPQLNPDLRAELLPEKMIRRFLDALTEDDSADGERRA